MFISWARIVMTDTPSVPENRPQILACPDGATIAYHHLAGRPPTVVFLGGYASDMTGSKATFLEASCRASGQAFLRFDYRGHGASSGAFSDGTIGLWAGDAVTAIEAATDGPLVLVGSSMGGWIMLLAALALKPRVAGLIGIAAAPDFTEDLMWDEFDLKQRAALERDGVLDMPSDYDDEPYTVTMALIEDGREHLVLREPIPLTCPVRLLHGLEDKDVPWTVSMRLAEAIKSEDVTVTLVKGAGHRLSEPEDLARLERVVAELCGVTS